MPDDPVLARRRRYSLPCVCGTGSYCRRHLRYGIPLEERKRIEVGDPHVTNDQLCGGGVRVIRKTGRE